MTSLIPRTVSRYRRAFKGIGTRDGLDLEPAREAAVAAILAEVRYLFESERERMVALSWPHCFDALDGIDGPSFRAIGFRLTSDGLEPFRPESGELEYVCDTAPCSEKFAGCLLDEYTKEVYVLIP